MSDSKWIEQAKARLEDAKTQHLSHDLRRDMAIQLAGWMLREANRTQRRSERARGAEMARMMKDVNGKAFSTMMTDQCFRSHRSWRVADQLTYLLDRFGVPHFLSWGKRVGMRLFKRFARTLPACFAPIASQMIKKEMSQVILPGEDRALRKHIARRYKQGVRVNFNHLGEAILGEEEAKKRLQLYLDALAKPEIEYVSVKVSSICSQLNLLAWDQTLDVLKERLRSLYRAAMKHPYKRSDGTSVQKFVNLDMEEYRDLHLTVELFMNVLDEEEFHQYSGGIVLQAYLPDSFEFQKTITKWAVERVRKERAPVKIRIVKGANLAMEQVEAALHTWPQAPYADKTHVDANYKRMLTYGCRKDHARAVHLGVASHNLFDIAYALILRAENGVEEEVNFEMLEGMADHMRRVVQQLSGDMLLYCPAAGEQEFQTAVAYLMRRLDENTAEQNFLRHSFGLDVGTPAWEKEVKRFSQACKLARQTGEGPRRQQNRWLEKGTVKLNGVFDNEADTDFALPNNRDWAQNIIKDSYDAEFDTLPLVIAGRAHTTSITRVGEDPSRPRHVLYRFSQASEQQVEDALNSAVKAQSSWGNKDLEERLEIISKVAQGLRDNRGKLIGLMVADGGKTITEADTEISEAIDFAEYYKCSMRELDRLDGLSWKPKGTVLVIPPWNFPCAIPMGGVIGGLVTGNTVIFKPASATALVAYHLAQICWEAGVPKDVLQFVTCAAHPEGSKLVSDPRVDVVILTGGTSTALKFLELRPDIDLVAETGGKNAIIVTSMADRDLAIKDVVYSAFGHAGQKCSACSLLILEKELYDDQHFLEQLRDAAASLKVGSAWDLETKITPLIQQPDGVLAKGLSQLADGESWLLEPQVDEENPKLWSPGIKIGVKEGAFTHKNELFGPVLSIMRAEDLQDAVRLANMTDYGLTSGLQSLDEREHAYWLENIEAGNYYINRGTTGAIVRRQPFGGCKASSFGRGSKAGGPNYLSQFLRVEETAIPRDRGALSGEARRVQQLITRCHMPTEAKELFECSVRSYAYWWEQHFSQSHDPSLLQGQDNLFSYRAHEKVCIRATESTEFLDAARMIEAALICGCQVEVSGTAAVLRDLERLTKLNFVAEDDAALAQRIESGQVPHLRCVEKPTEDIYAALAKGHCRLHLGPVLAHGRIELLHYVREISVSIDYHRYGNLGEREQEARRELPHPITE